MTAENISRIAADFETQLSSAISVGSTSFTIQSVLDADGNTLSDGIYAFTVDRDNSDQKEYFIGQLTSATKTISSISSVSRQGVLTANAQRAHRIGANVIISTHSILSAIARIFNGLGKINPAAPLEYDSAPSLSADNQLATVKYVLDTIAGEGGTINTDRLIVGSQIAGEDVSIGDIVYFKSSDSRWWKAVATDQATFYGVQLGVAQGTGTPGNAISGGVLIYGKCDLFTGLTATATYYLSDTAGEISSIPGTLTVLLGQAFSTVGIFLNPVSGLSLAISESTGVSDADKIIKTNASGVLDSSFLSFDFNLGDGSDGDVTISSATTLTRDMHYNNLIVNDVLSTDGFKIYVKGTISGTGTVQGVNGGNASGTTGGSGGGAGIFKAVAGGAGGAATAVNAVGNNGTAGTAGFVHTTGSAGGNGGAANKAAGSGGSGGGYTPVDRLKTTLLLYGLSMTTAGALQVLVPASAGGGGSGGGGTNAGGGAGGGGGASGGCVLIAAKVWSGTFTIKSTGGNGANGNASTGNGGTGGGGGGGNGGDAYIIYGTKTWTGSYNLAGGTGGTGANAGTAGTNGQSFEIKRYLL